MGNGDFPVFELDCPCCGARLSVDAHLGVVLSHVAAKAPPYVDLDDAERMLREQRERIEEKFRQSVAAEKIKDDVLERKFTEGLRRAKDTPLEKPLRDFDLD
jgi:hypothetical protein